MKDPLNRRVYQAVGNADPLGWIAKTVLYRNVEKLVKNIGEHNAQRLLFVGCFIGGWGGIVDGYGDCTVVREWVREVRRWHERNARTRPGVNVVYRFVHERNSIVGRPRKAHHSSSYPGWFYVQIDEGRGWYFVVDIRNISARFGAVGLIRQLLPDKWINDLDQEIYTAFGAKDATL